MTQPRPSSLSRPRAQAWQAPILWVVVASGLVITLSAYLLLKNFVDQAIQANRQGHHDEVVQLLESHLNYTHIKLRALRHVTIDPNQPALVEQGFDRLRQNDLWLPLDYILWWPVGTTSSQSGRVLLGNTIHGQRLLSQYQKNLASLWADLTGPDQMVLEKIMDLGPLQIDHLDMAPRGWFRIKSDHILLGQRDQPVLSGSGHRIGILVALMSTKDLLNQDMLRQNSLLERLVLKNKDDEHLIDVFRVGLSTDPDPIFSSRSGYKATLDVMGNALSAEIWLADDRQNLVLKLIPNILLLFGLMVTFLGSLYVYNNQRQSLIMGRVNRTLALKNMEMNTQMTERERLNHVLRRAEKEHRDILNSVTDVIFEIDQRGKILFLNDTWRRITGWAAENTLGRLLFDLLAGDGSRSYSQELDELVMGRRSAFQFRTYLARSDDTRRLVEVAYSMIRVDDQNNPRIVGTITDIEDRVRAEQTLADAQARYRTFFEHAVSGIYQIDPDGKLLSANQSLAHIFGYADALDMQDQVKNFNHDLFTHHRRRQELLRQAEQEGQVTKIEHEAKRRDGTAFWVMESIRAVRNDQNKIQYFEGSMDDITERKQAELDLKVAMHQSDLANRSKTEFLANMSHELRTPLNAIIGFSEIIRDEVLGPMGTDAYRDYARDIHDSGKNLLSIINTILDVARIEAGERQLNESYINLVAMLDNVVDLIRPRLETNTQTLAIDLPDPVPELLGEELAVKQIVLNLLSNASKFTPSDGHITIKVSLDHDQSLRLAVSDTGLGLDPEEIARLMAPFGQVSGSFDRRSSGPGLGLTLVNAMTRLHGGIFELVSQKGIGTTASVVFPANRVKQP